MASDDRLREIEAELVLLSALGFTCKWIEMSMNRHFLSESSLFSHCWFYFSVGLILITCRASQMYHRPAGSKAWDQNSGNWHPAPSCSVPPCKAFGQTAELALRLCSSTTKMKTCPDLSCLLSYELLMAALLKGCPGFLQFSHLPGN